MNGDTRGIQRLCVRQGEGIDRRSVPEPPHGIELLGKCGFEVVAESFAFGLVDHADGAFEQCGGEIVAQRLISRR